MERKLSISDAHSIFGADFIGPDEIDKIARHLQVAQPLWQQIDLPVIPFSQEELEEKRGSHILALLMPFRIGETGFSLVHLRNVFGTDPSIEEPCFYNQDWYLNEQFAKKCTVELKWQLFSKEVIGGSKGKSEGYVSQQKLPTALTCAYIFFAYYFLNKEVLWQKNFIWCSDKDANGDRIYVGRYIDPLGIAKNGFSIHRHLSITPVYGCVEVL